MDLGVSWAFRGILVLGGVLVLAPSTVCAIVMVVLMTLLMNKLTSIAIPTYF